MFKKILIANRGEIAIRIIRACREMGIETVAVFSTADREALHVQMADEAVCIGPPSPYDSYLNIKNIISAAALTSCEAIHPGFAYSANMVFIGPDADTIESMGNKSKARQMMIEAGVPVILGSTSPVLSDDDAIKAAKDIGYPVMIKASAGGGGRGIRIVRKEEELIFNLQNAKSEAKSAFGDDTVYIEKYLENPRHVEMQILGDNYGNIIYLGERDCSIQRRNQKVLEEAPCPILTQKLREKMGKTSLLAAKYVGYKGAGTVEFLLDKDNNFYFMEMNTRIQVEHPITELVTGIDIVKEQIKIAAGEKLDIMQEDVEVKGHSIECRINAEDTENGFMPCPGKVKVLFIPGGLGVRVDTHLYDGYIVPPFYDSMIAKLIVHGKDREEAINRMRRALSEFLVEGIKTNIEYQFNIINNESFIKGDYDTGFISTNLNRG